MPAVESDRNAVELLAEQFAQAIRAGQQPSIEAYAAAHPQHAEAIRKLFPTIQSLEQMRHRIERPVDGKASLGPARLERLGDLKILREIGRGGMGIVYEAVQESLGRKVAVKVLPKAGLLDKNTLARFLREARTAAGLHHTNIVPVLGVGQHEGFYYYVMQLIQGCGLDELIARRRLTAAPKSQRDSAAAPQPAETAASHPSPVDTAAGQPPIAPAEGVPLTVPLRETARHTASTPPPSADASEKSAKSGAVRDTDFQLSGEGAEGIAAAAAEGAAYWSFVADLGRQAAEALAHAHAHGTLHRDIKPGNLILDREGTLWVADFGVAKSVEQPGVSRTGDVVGTLGYMAPEQLSGQADQRSDIYSLGLTLYEMLTLSPAFDSASARSRVQGGANTVEPPPPRSKNPAIPRDLETILLAAISHAPEHRYQQASDLAADLVRFLEDRPVLARRAPFWERAYRWARRNPAVAALSAVSLLLLIATTVVTTLGYWRAAKSAAAELAQRQKTEKVLGVSLTALDHAYERFAGDRSRGAGGGDFSSDGQAALPAQLTISKDTAAVLQEMLSAYNELAALESSDPRIRLEAARAHRRMGDIRQRLGQTDLARESYSEAIHRYESLLSISDLAGETRAEIARIRLELGNVEVQSGKSDLGRQSYLEALGTLREYQSADSPPERQYELARCYYYLGRPQKNNLPDPGPPIGGGPRPARPGQLMAVLGDLFGEPRGEGPEGDSSPPPRRPRPPGQGGGPPDGPPRDGPRGEGPPREGPRGEGPRGGGPPGRFPPGPPGGPPGARRPGPAERDEMQRPDPPGRGETAPRRPPAPALDAQQREYLSTAVAILTPLHQKAPAVAEYARLLALCLQELQPGLKKIEEDQPLTLLAEIVQQHPEVQDYRHDLAEAYGGFDVLSTPAEQYSLAEARLRKGWELARDLDPATPAYAVSRVHIALRLATMLRESQPRTQARLSEAVELCRSALELQKKIAADAPDSELQIAWLARVRVILCGLLAHRGHPPDLDEAITLNKQLVADLESNKERLSDKRLWNDLLGSAHHELGLIHQRRGNNDAARAAFDRARQYHDASEQAVGGQ